MEKIDILLATYNGEKYVREQLDSILNQTYSNIRLLVSDDCSTDGTRLILEEYKKRDSRVNIFYQNENMGSTKNFEFLLKKVQSNIYALSDQDDVWLPNKIEKLYNKMIEDNADLVFSDLEVVDENLKTIYPSFNDYMKLTRKIKKSIGNIKLEYLYNCITGCTIMGRSSFIDKILPFPCESKYVIHDSWIGLVLAINGKITYLDESTIKYRQHNGNQIGANKVSHGFKDYKAVRDLFIDVKIDLFKTYVNNNKIFDIITQNKNTEYYEYFKMLKGKKYINFSKWNLFYELYKDETKFYFFTNFFIMNIPIVFKIIFKIRNLFKFGIIHKN